ncbi:MAG TPA: polymer-forming cytoskeletal protein [Methylomirabilota bacterium]|nr:polymer-forming cytoskeletal protein [Methylomirabilota bacterium]
MGLFSNEPETSVHLEQSAKSHNGSPQAALPSTPAQKIVAPAVSSAAGYLDHGTKISGKLRFDGPARIDGTIDGEVDGKEITIGESAVVTAQIRADSIVVCGKVKGEITATQKIEIHPTAKIVGNITTPKLIIHEGAIFEGQCSMGQESDRDRKVRAVS